MPGRSSGDWIVERDLAFEVAIPKVAGGSSQIFHMAVEFAAGHGDNGNFGFVAESDVSAIELIHAARRPPIVEVGNFCDGHAGIHGVAHLQKRERHAAIDKETCWDCLMET